MIFRKTLNSYILKKWMLKSSLIELSLTETIRLKSPKRTVFLSRVSKNNAITSLIDAEYDKETKRLYKHPGSGHNMLIIQPKIRIDSKFESEDALNLKLSEAVSLVNTLPNWTVYDKHIINVAGLKSKLLFGSGNLEKIKNIVRGNLSISAVFIAIDILTAAQNSKLENIFKVQVFDRYQIILQIFHDHAHTQEAKLQLALAEIPYLRIKLAGYSYTRDSSTFSEITHVGGDGETYMEVRRRLLNERELKLKKQLEKIKDQRHLLRKSDMRKAFPIIAIVGYTNCGKTTLIKSLTNDEKLLPEDKLFATLDVTLHPGFLPSAQKVLFIDTVGFISDVPTKLIQSFRSTLEEINLADLVVHVRDISHPDAEKQKQTVLTTLECLDLPSNLLSSIVEVKNKIDLVDQSVMTNEDNDILISATEGTGLPLLLEVIEQKLFENTGHSAILLRVPNGKEEYRWLLKNAAVTGAIADENDANYLIVEVVLSVANLAKFKHNFGDLTVPLESVIK